MFVISWLELNVTSNSTEMIKGDVTQKHIDLYHLFSFLQF